MKQTSCIIHSNSHVWVFICMCYINVCVVLCCICIWLITGPVDYYNRQEEIVKLKLGRKKKNLKKRKIQHTELRVTLLYYLFSSFTDAHMTIKGTFDTEFWLITCMVFIYVGNILCWCLLCPLSWSFNINAINYTLDYLFDVCWCENKCVSVVQRKSWSGKEKNAISRS